MTAIPPIYAALLLLAVMPLAAAAYGVPQDPPPDATEQERATPPPASPGPPASQTRQASQEIDEAVAAIRGYSAELRDQAMANAKRAADDLDQQMAHLQAQTDRNWARMSQAARSRSQAAMADLRMRRNALAEWVGGMRHGSAAAWDEVKAGFVSSYGELAAAVRKAAAQFEQDENDDKDAAEPPPPDQDP